jgi:hypothetical protein
LARVRIGFEFGEALRQKQCDEGGKTVITLESG